MVTERDIEGWSQALITSIQKDDVPTSLEAATRLIATAITDLHRIADALEQIALNTPRNHG